MNNVCCEKNCTPPPPRCCIYSIRVRGGMISFPHWMIESEMPMNSFNAGKFHNHEFYFESDLSSKTLENISIMRSLSISRACLTLGGVFWRFRLSLTICPRDKRPCSSTVANTSRDFVTMVSWRAMATTVGSQKLYPGNCHSLCLSKEVRSMVLWNMAFEVFIFRMRFNQSFKKKTKYRTFYN